GSRAEDPGNSEAASARFHRAGALHADPLPGICECLSAPHHQHSSFVLTGIRRSETVSPGLSAWREADRGHESLRNRRPRRWSHHRTRCGPHLTPRSGRGFDSEGPRLGESRSLTRGALAYRESGAALWKEDGSVWLDRD